MRLQFAPLLILSLGCGQGEMEFKGPTVDTFTGQLVHDGKPVAFADQKASLQMFSDKAESFGVPLTPAGEFTIGKMPIGKYTVNLLREKPGSKPKSNAPAPYTVPGGLTIEAGKNDYTVELGKGFKP